MAFSEFNLPLLQPSELNFCLELIQIQIQMTELAASFHNYVAGQSFSMLAAAAAAILCSPWAHLDVQRGEVAVQLLRVVDVRLAAHGTDHVPDVLVPHGDGEVDPEALVTHGALAGGQRLHLDQRGTEEEDETPRLTD